MLKQITIAAAAVALLGLAACDGGSAEKAGENMDSSIEEATQGEKNLGDGAFENAGEAVDGATGTERTDSAADAIHDATDDNPNN